jgi:hypothetical protein
LDEGDEMRFSDAEGRAFGQVRQRLVDRFPDVPTDVIWGVVQEERRRLEERPVRDFVPLLVERASADRLRGAGARRIRADQFVPRQRGEP